MIVWTRYVENADSPYPEDKQYSWTCELLGLEITKEGDGKYWLRHKGKPLGFGPRLKDAKAEAERFIEAASNV